MLFTCQAGYESLLARELSKGKAVARELSHGPGWVLGSEIPGPLGVLVFPHVTLLGPQEIHAASVNALARGVVDFLLGNLQGEAVTEPWPDLWLGQGETPGLSRRISAVEQAFRELLRQRLSRVARLAESGLPTGRGRRRGLAVFFPAFDRALVTREFFVHGPRRVADDSRAPSRSYLKIEEACLLLGAAPKVGETVVDLGAAPGGWSYSAARHGARVVAVDNGPLKGAARDHPQIEHRREDAFRFHPDSGQIFDWLYCDLVEEPHHVLRQIVTPWLEHGWCRRFVVNLKFGRVDPIALLRELRDPGSPLMRFGSDVRIHHLFHDREEFTVMGRVGAKDE